MHTNNGHHPESIPPSGPDATAEHLQAVADAIGDTPETVIALQFLREGSVDVLCVGDPADFEGIMIQLRDMPAEPIAFGSSADALASLLPHLSGWTCVNVPGDLADDLIEPVATTAGATTVRLLDDVHHVLRRPVDEALIGPARLLTSVDHDLVAHAPEVLLGAGVDRVLDRLATGHVAGVIEQESLVALALTFAISDRHADIGVATHVDWRQRGFGTGVAACVAAAVQRDGRIPVWSCGATNLASMAIASRLGFEELTRRVYLIPDWDDEAQPDGE